jgi:hypothetical protein
VSPAVRRALAAALACWAAHAGAQDAVTREGFAAAIREIQQAFIAERFDRVEALHGENVGRRTEDGTSMVEAFEYAFDAMFSAHALPRLEGALTDWKAAAPASRLRPIAEAFMWQQRAQRAHGAWCKPLDPAGRPLAEKYLGRAQAALAEADAAASPLWFSAALRVAGSRGDTTDQLDRLLDRGAAAHPGYLPMYWARGRFMLPPWAKDYDGFDTFARTRASAGIGSGATSYALMYVTVARSTCHSFLEETGVSWQQMKLGLEELARSRGADWNWNLLGTFACRFRDVEATRRVLERLGPAARLDIFTSGQSTESCRLMARGERAPPRHEERAELTGVKVGGSGAFLYFR